MTKSFVDKYSKKSRPTPPPPPSAPPQNQQNTNDQSIPNVDNNNQTQEDISKTLAERYASKKSSYQSKSTPTANSQADLIYLVKGVDDGKNAWYYILVERLKLSLFLKALNDPIIHLEEYGKILYSAYGDEPPKEITDKLKAEYGIK